MEWTEAVVLLAVLAVLALNYRTARLLISTNRDLTEQLIASNNHWVAQVVQNLRASRPSEIEGAPEPRAEEQDFEDELLG